MRKRNSRHIKCIKIKLIKISHPHLILVKSRELSIYTATLQITDHYHKLSLDYSPSSRSLSIKSVLLLIKSEKLISIHESSSKGRNANRKHRQTN